MWRFLLLCSIIISAHSQLQCWTFGGGTAQLQFIPQSNLSGCFDSPSALNDKIFGYINSNWLGEVNLYPYKYIKEPHYPAPNGEFLCQIDPFPIVKGSGYTCVCNYVEHRIDYVYNTEEIVRNYTCGWYSLQQINDVSKCYNPPGIDCSFYVDCLDKAIPCSGSTHEYAISYGDKFCKLYESDFSKFSVEAQKWINAVRKCLQQRLGSYLQSQTLTCKNVKEFAFSTHQGCYTAPENGLSICTLYGDIIQVLSTIKSSFLTDTKITTWQIIQSACTCGSKFIKKDTISVVSPSDVSEDIKRAIQTFKKWGADMADHLIVLKKSLTSYKRQVNGDEYYIVIIGTDEEPADKTLETIIIAYNNGNFQIFDNTTTPTPTPKPVTPTPTPTSTAPISILCSSRTSCETCVTSNQNGIKCVWSPNGNICTTPLSVPVGSLTGCSLCCPGTVCTVSRRPVTTMKCYIP